MRKYKKILPLLACSVLLFSCTDYDMKDFPVDKPESVLEREYLDSFDHLKNYLDRNQNPGFRLGAGTGLSDYTGKGVMYRLLNDNFDEIVMGWEMKHGAIVQANGYLDLANVEKLIETAREAGIFIYGHTLCWHVNQNASYLNGLIAPEVIPGGEPSWDEFFSVDFETADDSHYEYSPVAVVGFTADGEGAQGVGRALKLTNPQVQTNDYDCQLFIKFSPAMQAGETYRVTMDIRSDDPATFMVQAHTAPGAYLHWDLFGSVSTTTSWTTITREIVVDNTLNGTATFAFNLGETATTYYFDNILVEKYSEGVGSSWVELMVNGDFESDNMASFQSNGQAQMSRTTPGSDGSGHALKVTNPAVQANDYGSQLFLVFSNTMAEGDTYRLKMDVRADVATSFSTQAQSAPGQYLHWTVVGDVPVTTQWTELDYTINVTSELVGTSTIAFNLGLTATNFYFDNISLTTEEQGFIEKTPMKNARLSTRPWRHLLPG